MKSTNIVATLDKVSMQIFGRKRSEALGSGTCVKCEAVACSFDNPESEREYANCALCQACQNDMEAGFKRDANGGMQDGSCHKTEAPFPEVKADNGCWAGIERKPRGEK